MFSVPSFPENSPCEEHILGNSDGQDSAQLAEHESRTVCDLPACVLLPGAPGVLPSSPQTDLLFPESSLVLLPVLCWVPGRPLLFGPPRLPPYS